MGRIRYFAKNWKMGVHLIFRTKRFGVNNKWWSTYDSILGWSNWKKLGAVLIILPIIDNYKRMKFRAGACHFLTDESYKDAFNEMK